MPFAHRGGVNDVLPRDHQYMDWGHRLEVVKGVGQLSGVSLPGGNVACDYPAENAARRPTTVQRAAPGKSSFAVLALRVVEIRYPGCPAVSVGRSALFAHVVVVLASA
jgi:hypothetical protein